MKRIHLLVSLPGPFYLEVVVPNWILSIGQIELNFVLMLK